ncbi:MAG: hypothetical protein O2793_12200 [Proteobacteria bacterium]|nr:hypothetical protein [Pseudomonadota bacterium]MDA1254867.1 hypothetical protein [Pseudomonadota bacterium]
MKKIWSYSASTPTQRIGIILLILGFIIYSLWGIMRGYEFIDYFDPYYFPTTRNPVFYLSLYLIPLGLLLSLGYPILTNIKYWIMNGKLKPRAAKNINKRKVLHFKDNLSAFKFAVDLYTPSLQVNELSFGIIQEKIALKDGTIQFLVQLADKRKITFVSGFNDKYAETIQKGNLIYWGYIESVTPEPPMYLEGLGHIIATLNPEFDVNTSKWSIRKDLTK